MKPLSAQVHLALVTAKFGLTAFTAVLLAQWLVPKDVLSAAFVALLCIQPSLVTGLKAGLEQILASGLGAVSTIGFLLVFPITPFTTGASIAVTYAVATYMRMSYSALVVALFSSLYMTLLAQDTPFHTALLRFQSVILGVAVAIVFNAVFSPLFTKMNLAVRIERSIGAVRAQLLGLRAALVARDAGALEAQLASFQDTFRALGGVKDELADMRREFRLPWRPGRGSYGEVYLGDQCLRALELATHHAQDVAMAGVRMLNEADADVMEAATRAVQQAVDLLDLVSAGRYDRAAELSAEARAQLHQLVAEAGTTAPATNTGRLSPRVVMRFALVQLHAHLGEVVTSARWLEEARRDPDRAMTMAAGDSTGDPHALER